MKCTIIVVHNTALQSLITCPFIFEIIIHKTV